jgi:hypothetical protein
MYVYIVVASGTGHRFSGIQGVYRQKVDAIAHLTGIAWELKAQIQNRNTIATLSEYIYITGACEVK